MHQSNNNLELGLVSVIINCHNSEKYLNQAINSVYSQSYKKWEIIFWDNASTDNSANIAKAYDYRVKYFYQSNKSNLGLARNNAIKHAFGEFIAFLDCDDYWHHEKLEKQVKILRKFSNAGFVYTRTGIVNGTDLSSVTIPKFNNLPKGNIFYQLIHENFIPFPSVLIRNDALIKIGGVPEKLKHSTDYSIFLKLSSFFDAMSINETLSYYRVHDENLSHSQKILAVNENLEIITEYSDHQFYHSANRAHLCYKAIEFIKMGDFISCIVLLVKERIILSFVKIIFKKYFYAHS